MAIIKTKNVNMMFNAMLNSPSKGIVYRIS